MEEQDVTVTKRSTGARFGMISALIGFVYFIGMRMAGFDSTQGVASIFSYLLVIAILVFAHKYYKENGSGYMAYSEGIGISFWAGLTSGAISSVLTYVYVKFIDPAFLEDLKTLQMDAMAEKGMSDEQIDQAMGFASMFMSAEAMFIMAFIGSIISYVLIGLIVTIFTQKKSPETAF